ncbi:hypothetical protein [Nocardia violaceofusca]|nr:hypothetical protein [Nocardia violaceofusca]
MTLALALPVVATATDPSLLLDFVSIIIADHLDRGESTCDYTMEP